ncbi:hypothetical protein EDC01DRAFT_779404 [Geopyxis carbonaria]|nr:hypothetical protein EDC01DRAFT_779404 [Geopyxis carbonaria]
MNFNILTIVTAFVAGLCSAQAPAGSAPVIRPAWSLKITPGAINPPNTLPNPTTPIYASYIGGSMTTVPGYTGLSPNPTGFISGGDYLTGDQLNLWNLNSTMTMRLANGEMKMQWKGYAGKDAATFFVTPSMTGATQWSTILVHTEMTFTGAARDTYAALANSKMITTGRVLRDANTPSRRIVAPGVGAGVAKKRGKKAHKPTTTRTTKPAAAAADTANKKKRTRAPATPTAASTRPVRAKHTPVKYGVWGV